MSTPRPRWILTALTGVICLIATAMGSMPGTLAARAASGPRCYVKHNANGSNNGNSWTNAYTDLQDALADTDCEEIWVAKGAYNPGADPADTFTIDRELKLYGGFKGDETKRSKRKPDTRVTILSGDIDGDDDGGNADGNSILESYTEITGDNNQHVITIPGNPTAITSATVIDGFTITGGDSDDGGGGIQCGTIGGAVCSPTLKQLVFSGNRAGTYGGALHNYALHGTSAPILEEATFVGNFAGVDGGAMYNYAYGTATVTPTLAAVTFTDNYVFGNGGAIGNRAAFGADNNPTLTNVTFHDNRAEGNGGAMYTEASDTDSASSPTLTNVTFSLNQAENGGAIGGLEGAGATTGMTLTNVILWGDAADTAGNEMDLQGTILPIITNTILAAGCPGISGTGSPNCTNVLDADPMLAALGDYGGSTMTMPIQAGSSALNAGDNTGAPTDDQRGVERPQGPNVDIGATESEHHKKTFKSKGGKDGWVLESSITPNTGGSLNSSSEKIKLGDDAGDEQYIAILSFDTSSLPSDADTRTATLKIKNAGIVGDQVFGTLSPLRVDIIDGSFNGSSSLELEDFSANATTWEVADIPNVLTDNWYATDGGNFSDIAVDGTTQFRLRFDVPDTSDFEDDYLKFHSGNADSGNRPKLVVEYYRP